MRKFVYSTWFVAMMFGCGGGGGGDANDDLGEQIGLIEDLPAEEMLCSLIIGESTRVEVERALGEPTNESETSFGVTLQYWYGAYERFALGQGATLLVSFDTAGALEEPSVMGMTFPQCWRDQLEAREQ
jgi:hypothetical protein